MRLLALCLLFLPSCYYSQAISGQMEILRKQRPIADVIADPATKDSLKKRLELVGEIRAFADDRLRLPGAKTHYTRYADLGRPFVVWNVFAAPEYSLKPKSWWYPVVGKLEYRGFFDKESATSLASELADGGMDTAVGGIVAYSTLGFFRDPVLNTFIGSSETHLAGLLFHELTHHRFFLKGDTAFSECLATAVEEEGLRLWVEHRGSEKLNRGYRLYIRRRRDFVDLIAKTRADLQALYRSPKPDSPDEIGALRRAKAKIFAGLKSRIITLKTSRWNGYKGYDKWIERDLNNAHINTVAIYTKLVPGFKKLLREANYDFDVFFDSVEALSKLPEEQRTKHLTVLDNRQTR